MANPQLLDLYAIHPYPGSDNRPHRPAHSGMCSPANIIAREEKPNIVALNQKSAELAIVPTVWIDNTLPDLVAHHLLGQNRDARIATTVSS